MESEECVPGGVTATTVVPPPPPLLSQQSNPGRTRKRGSGINLMTSSSVEAQIGSHLAHHHHDKVLRSHTRRGRSGAAPLPTVSSVPFSTSTGTTRRRQQRTSCCSSHTDEDDGGIGGCVSGEYGEVSVSLLNLGEEIRGGKVEGDVTSGNGDNNSSTCNNNNKVVVVDRRAGGEQAVIIPSSTSCFAPTNETKELCEQAGLLGGPTKTTTIHSGGTRLSSSCIQPHNDLATQQCRSNNTGEHSGSISNNNDNNMKNCSQKITQGIADNNSAPARSRRRSRQHGHHHHHRDQSTPPAAGAADDDGDEDDNVRRRARGESGDDNNVEMCGEDAASCELSGKPNTAQQSSSSSISLLANSSSYKIAGALLSVTTASGIQVKSEHGVGGNDNTAAGKEKEERIKRQVKKEDQILVGNCESVRVKREVNEIIVDTDDLPGGVAGALLKVNKIGGHDGRWSAGEDAKQGKDKDGGKDDRKALSSSSFSLPASSSCSVGSSGGVSMPQKAGVKGIVQDDGGISAAGKEQSKPTKAGASSSLSSSVSVRCVKKSASGASAAAGSKKQAANASLSFNNNNNISVGAQSGSKNAKKAPVPAPMLLMNNLPYMGELTFDTRPRRGRKPKKADICHLISKNYGIQFPAGVTQATLTGLPIICTKAAQAPPAQSQRSKKTAETITVSSNSSTYSSSRSLVPPTFCNRDVSIVPIIPTTWGSSGGGGGGSGSPLSLPSTDSSSKCSSSPSNLLKPLSSLAQQLMLHHHQNPPHSSVSSTRSMPTITSSPQQSISMFPLPTPSSYSQTHQTGKVSRANSNNSKRSKNADYNDGEDDDDNIMEVDVESHEGDGEDDEEDSPLNLCMRDKTKLLSHHRPHEPLSLVKEESLDVRWSRSGGGGGANKGMVRSSSNINSSNYSYTSDGANNREGGSNKRGMIQSSSANSMMKGGKSAKLTGGTSRPSSSLNFSLVNSSNSNNVCESESVSNLVSCRPSPSPSSSPFGNVQQQSSKLSPNIFAISAHHLQSQGLEGAGKAGGGKGKQGGQSRKKREINLRGDVSISSAGSPGSQSGSGGTPSGSTPLSSFGGTLFGQSTAGLNDAAEVSICKFKFTGGAKPCLQEKKMLSVDSGGNFRFYSDKTTGGGNTGQGSTGKLAGKGQQQQLPLSSASGSSNAVYSAGGRADISQSPPSTGDGVECHYALSSLPKSAKSMSMCMPQGAVSSSGIQVQMSSPTTTFSVSGKGKCNAVVPTKLTLPLMASSSSSSSATATVSNPYTSLSISPTAEELQQLHLSMQDQVQRSQSSSSRVSPYPSGDYSYSSSNSCSSSDNCFGGDTPSSSSVKRQASSSHSHNYRSGSGGGSSSGKLKLKRKRRTRKSLMREKLEKTFKEKGFLIQTQQLESAEGATYCKFRQLRKFTRYLFRSWKDYLPDHVKEISDNNANNNGAMPGSEQGLPNNQQASNSIGHKEDGSNVQSMVDDDGDLEDDDEDDGDEDDEADSEEQPRQRLISPDNTVANDEEDEESDEDDDEDYDGVIAHQRQVFKAGRKGKCAESAVGKASSETQIVGSDNRNDADSSKEEDDNEDVELQVDA